MSNVSYPDGGNLLLNPHRALAEDRRIASYLREVRDGCLYAEDNYQTFAEFCEKEFGMSYETAESLIRSLGQYEASQN